MRVFKRRRNSKLLSLPTELRLYIFELALREDHGSKGEVSLHPGMGLPALLQTCPQIQNDVYPVWLSKTTFFVQVRCCKDDFLHGFVKLSNEFNVLPRVHIQLAGTKKWKKLLTWCKRIWMGKSLFVEPQGDMSSLQTVVRAAHGITLQHSHGSWEVCERALLAEKSPSGELGTEWYNEKGHTKSEKKKAR